MRDLHRAIRVTKTTPLKFNTSRSVCTPKVGGGVRDIHLLGVWSKSLIKGQIRHPDNPTRFQKDRELQESIAGAERQNKRQHPRHSGHEGKHERVEGGGFHFAAALAGAPGERIAEER